MTYCAPIARGLLVAALLSCLAVLSAIGRSSHQDLPGTRRDDAAARLAAAGAGLDVFQRGLLRTLVEAALELQDGPLPAEPAAPGPHAVFAPGTPQDVVQAFYARFPEHGRYQGTSRWSFTATQPGGLAQGDPTILTWGFALDGTPIQGQAVGSENPADTSNARAFFAGIYGSQAAADAVFQRVFDRWQELTGLTLVREPNDDGASMGSGGAAGVLGVRADVRIGGRFLDGTSQVLAYNYFPNNGDMVFDTGDGWYAGSGLAGDSLGTRNVIAHEHGHGLGMSHVCPVSQSKLMEPFVSLDFDGPQHDDILGGQRKYGDPDEHNDSVATATDLGSLPDGTTTRDLRSIDDATSTDVDYYAFTAPAGRQATITVTPLGQSYLEGPQDPNGSCSPGSTFDSLTLMNLDVRLISTDGVTQLGIGNVAGAGIAETTGAVSLPAGGTYYVHVYGAPVVANAQLYRLDVTLATTSRTLTVTKAGSGTGTVTSAPAGIACGGTCSMDLADGSTVTLTATPDPGSVFAGFGNAVDCLDGVVTLTSGVTCSATFSPDPGPAPGPSAGAAGVVPYTPDPLDLDGDGRGDAIDYNVADGGAAIRSGGPPAGGASAILVDASQVAWSPGWTIAPGDFDGDGQTDLLFYDEVTGAWLKGISDGALGFTFAGGTWSPGWSLAVLELDGDGLADVFLYNPASGAWFRGTSTGDGTGDFAFVGGSWSPGWQIHPISLDGDGLTDLFLYDLTTGVWFRAVNDGTGFTFTQGAWSPGWQISPGDYDGAGPTDLFLYDVATGAWYVALDTGTGWAFTGGTFSPGWTVRPGDFSGDGRTDLLLYDVALGSWFVCVSDGAGGWSAHVPGSWSPNWQVAVTSFDQDAAADLLLYDATTGAYYQAFTVTPGVFTYQGGNWGGSKQIIAERP